jgi:hypothetical protein
MPRDENPSAGRLDYSAGTEGDALSLFPSEDSAANRDGGTESRLPVNAGPMPGGPAIGGAVWADSTGLSERPQLLAQAASVLERSRRSMETLCPDRHELREAGAPLAQERASPGDAGVEQRILTESLNRIEDRLGQLDVMPDLTNRMLASLQSLITAVGLVEADYDAQQPLMHQGLCDDARRIAEGPTALDEPVGKASQDDAAYEVRNREPQDAEATRAKVFAGAADPRDSTRVLARAASIVAQLERRAADVSAQLAAMTTSQRALARQLVSLRQQWQSLTESARNDSAQSVRRQRPSDVVVPTPVSRSFRREASTSGIPSPQPRKVQIGYGSAGVGALVVLGLVLSADAKRSGNLPGSVRAEQRESASPRSAVLPSTTLGVALSIPSIRGLTGMNDMALTRRDPSGTATRADDVNMARAIANVQLDRWGSLVEKIDQRTTPPSSFIVGSNAAQPFSGMLHVDSIPSRAAVFINQQRVGDTPLQLERVRAGSHVLWIEREGYERWTTSILVTSDKQNDVRATLQPVSDRR